MTALSLIWLSTDSEPPAALIEAAHELGISVATDSLASNDRRSDPNSCTIGVGSLDDTDNTDDLLAAMTRARDADPSTPFLLVTEHEEVRARIPHALNASVVGLLHPPVTREIAVTQLTAALEVWRLRTNVRNGSDHVGVDVLVIEDDDADYELVAEYLTPLSKRPSRACRLGDAMAHLERHLADVIIADLSLPDARGVDVVMAIKSAYPEVALVVVSGLVDAALSQQLVHLGAQDCLGKNDLDAGRLTHAIMTALERSAIGRQAEFLSTHDELTGLPNRRLFDARFATVLERAARTDGDVSVMIMDLDGFKPVNDTHGHLVGDEVLATIGHRLEHELRGYDIAARIGGDEFALLIDADETAARSVAERVIEAVSQPIDTSVGPTSVGASAGIAASARCGTDPTCLVNFADRALYRAKQWRRGQVVCWGAPELDAAHLGAAADPMDRPTSVWFEPLADLDTGDIIGWNVFPAHDPTRPEHRHRPTIDALLRAARGSFARRYVGGDHRSDDRIVALDLSEPDWLDDETLGDVITEVGCWSRQQPIQLRVADASLARDPRRSLRMTGALVAAGATVTVTGFGVGDRALPLTWLRRLPISGVVVTADAADDPHLLRAIIELARTVGLSVTADDIVDEDQLRTLTEAGCTTGAGRLLTGRSKTPRADRARLPERAVRPHRPARVEQIASPEAELRHLEYAISHDLRAPLRAVASFASLLDRPGLDAEKTERYLAHIRAGSAQLEAMIEGILTLSRIGRDERPLAPVDTDAALATAVDPFRPTLERTGGRLTAMPLAPVLGRPEDVTRLFAEIVENAMKFSGDAPARIEVTATSMSDGMVHIEVHDDGIGIDPADQLRVFDVFTRLHHRSEYDGEGLGLAIARRSARALGGDVLIADDTTHGTTVRIALPST